MSMTEPADTAAAVAFDELRREVSLTRAALEGLTAARERVPDYAPTLGQIAERLKLTAAAVERIEKAPAVRLSPDAMVAEMIKASAVARVEDARLIHETLDALSQTIGRLDGIVKRGQAADAQIARLLWAAAAGLLVGILIWSILPGAIARSLPASWQVPQWMAARTIGAGGGS